MPVDTLDATRWEECASAVYVLDPSTGLPTGSEGTPLEIKLPKWHYIGNWVFTLDGTNDTEAAIPADATVFELRAEVGEVYFEINGVNCDALAGGYVPADGAETVGPLDNLNSLWVYSATAATVVHCLFFNEA